MILKISAKKRILVAYSSKYGYVEEIITKISDALYKKGFLVDLLNLSKINQKKWPSLEEFDGLIVGSCGSSLGPFWRKEAKNFVSRNLEKLSSTDKILGFFYSDPRILNLIIDPSGAQKVAANSMYSTFGFVPKYSLDFGPAFDLAHGFKKISPEDRDRIRRIVKAISKKTGIEFNFKGFNDFRDWNLIQEFVDQFSNDIIQK